MNYKYRVTLAGIKGFFRLYHVSGNNSLYTFHKQLQSDLEFPADQPILFKALDENGDVMARYALIDLGFGTADKVKIADTVKAGVRSFIYFYDTIAKKSVIVTLEEETPDAVSVPTLLETKGPAPIEFENGYVAFEDLPEEHRHLPGETCHCHDKDCEEEDDDEEDFEDDENEDEEEDSGKEEEELVYDGDEL
ncbi:MAG: plasmid pRiA4b ORF-3 family protein [Bacteroidales bacterium]|nr:plasmid pRiA4b ORF-3 family protein [Bacteroidales bacterium]